MNCETAYIGFGSNLGDRQKYIFDAINLLKNTQGIFLCEVSPIYETKPVGYKDQPDFLNCVAKIETTLSPEKLLDACVYIENELERKRIIKWGPRTIDLDVLFYGDLIVNNENLKIPHPLLHEREFVLVPLKDLSPDFRHPKFHNSIDELYKSFLKKHKSTDEIKRFGD